MLEYINQILNHNSNIELPKGFIRVWRIYPIQRRFIFKTDFLFHVLIFYKSHNKKDFKKKKKKRKKKEILNAEFNLIKTNIFSDVIRRYKKKKKKHLTKINPPTQVKEIELKERRGLFIFSLLFRNCSKTQDTAFILKHNKRKCFVFFFFKLAIYYNIFTRVMFYLSQFGLFLSNKKQKNHKYLFNIKIVLYQNRTQIQQYANFQNFTDKCRNSSCSYFLISKHTFKINYNFNIDNNNEKQTRQ